MALSFQITSTSDELKRRLIESVEKQQENFLEQAEIFYSQEQRSTENYLNFARAIVKAVDEILTQNPWEDSLFARNCLRPLKDIRDQAEQMIQAEKNRPNLRRPTFIGHHKKIPLQKVYIALFQSRGYELKQWELQLKSIESHLVGRPVYRNEQEVQAALRLKNAPIQEAYIEVDVPETKIHKDLTREDRYGHALLSLAHDAVNPEYIRGFVHGGKRYDFIDGKLKEKREE